MGIVSGGGGGAALPSQWTTDAFGNLALAPTHGDATQNANLILKPVSGDPNLKVIASSDSNDALAITDSTKPNGQNFGVDPLGYIAGSGLDLEATGNVSVLLVGAKSGQTGGHLALFSDKNGNPSFWLNVSGGIGFFGATPAAQPVAIANAAGGVVIDAEARTALNSLLASARTLGLIAT